MNQGKLHRNGKREEQRYYLGRGCQSVASHTQIRACDAPGRELGALWCARYAENISDEKRKECSKQSTKSLSGDNRVTDDSACDSAPGSLTSLSQTGSSRGSRSCRSELVLLGRLSVGGGSASLRLSNRNLADSTHGERRSIMYLASCISK